MFINHDPKFIFIDIAKTGSMSISKALREHFKGSYMEPEGWNYTRAHQPTFRYPERWVDYYKFIVIRHPYDRLCSLWWATCVRESRKHLYGYLEEMEENTFYNFINAYFDRTMSIEWTTYFFRKDVVLRSKHAVPQNFYLESHNFDKIIRFENLQEEFNEIPYFKDIKLPMINATKVENEYDNKNIRPPTEEIITQREKDLIYEYFPEEFEPLGYER